MALDFGKLNFAVGFNRTSAFPLDANSYFEDYNLAVEAAASAAEVGSSDSAYYIGQILIVNDKTASSETYTNKGLGLYQITSAKTLIKFGQASSADELGERVSALESQITTINGKLILASTDADGFMSKEDKSKLDAIEAGAQVNKIESIKVNGEAQEVTDKSVNIDLSTYATKTELEAVQDVANAAVVANPDITGGTHTKITYDAKGLVTGGSDLTAEDIPTIPESKVEGLAEKLTGIQTDLRNVYTKTEADTKIAEEIGKQAHFSAQVVTDKALMTDTKVLYLYKPEGATGKDAYEEYMVIDGVPTLIGETSVDLTDYAKSSDVTSAINDAKNELSTTIGSLDTKVSAVETDLSAYKTSVSDTYKTKAEAQTDKTELTELINAKASAEDLATLTGTVSSNTSKIEALQTADDTLTQRIKALEDVGAEANYVKSVDTDLDVDTDGKLSITSISQAKVTGLADALAGKVDKIEGWTLLSPTNQTKLDALVIGESGVEISGKVNASNVEGLGDWITTNRDSIGGLLSADQETKLNGIEAGAEVNKIDAVKINGTDLVITDKSVNIPLASNTTVGVVLGSTTENKVSVGSDGTMEVNSVNVNKLSQTEGDTLVLDGGNA